MRSPEFRHVVVAAALTAALGAGCGSSGKDEKAAGATTVKEGALILKDAFDDNHNGWLTVKRLVTIKGGEYAWLEAPASGGDSLPDTLLKAKLPAGVAASVAAEQTAGAGLRGMACREIGAADRTDWYELGIDGRRALIRRMKAAQPPKVLASADMPVANGKRVRLTVHCVPDGGDGLLLALLVDGKQAVSTHDAKPITGKPGTVSVFEYLRPDSKGPANMVWDDFELREASTVVE